MFHRLISALLVSDLFCGCISLLHALYIWYTWYIYTVSTYCTVGTYGTVGTHGTYGTGGIYSTGGTYDAIGSYIWYARYLCHKKGVYSTSCTICSYQLCHLNQYSISIVIQTKAAYDKIIWLVGTGSWYQVAAKYFRLLNLHTKTAGKDWYQVAAKWINGALSKLYITN